MNGKTQKSVLIIDDDPIIRELLNQQLTSNFYNIYEASKPSEAQKILDDNNIDLVLCDIIMPEMDGYEFCSIVRKNKKHSLIPFIFITGDPTIGSKSKALDAGADDLIFKPIEIDDLLFKIQALLRRSDIYKSYGKKNNVENNFAEQQAKILLVDDDKSLGMLFQYNLKKVGFECEFAPSAGEGFKKAKEFKPDLIISDIMMPEKDGFEFRRMVLADDSLKGIPFVFLTSKGEEDDILEGYNLGIADYVLKTAGPRVVVAKVSAIVKSLGKERQKAVSELQHAADSMHIKVVPNEAPEFEGFEITQWHQTYKGIPGGDFLDYFTLDENNLAIILGDVMGKKWGAWYFAFAYAGYVRSAIRVVLQNTKDLTPSVILQQVNKSVYKDAKVSEVFATLSIIILNKKEKTLKYTGAGDLPILYLDRVNNELRKLRSKGLLLGFAPDGNYEDVNLSLNKNDYIFIFTDGIIESRNTEGEQFGSKKMSEVIKNMSLLDNPMKKLKEEFRNFTGGNYEDDISLITIKAL
ncbi:MAG: response regulator [Bacteroidetes bacterium]|nr:response regulator [Bacteroidota bacterium]MCH8170435.1 response regulator [Bacteroidota bacterium]MCH8941685.1 response regulator [Bacteroidota bacterium]